jgi:PIN domain nuclease of toxin-antitoxin system
MRQNANRYVLDSSALLASLKSEPGGDLVDSVIEHSVISSVNLSEVVASLLNGGVSRDLIIDVLRRQSFEVVPFDREQAYDAGLLRASTIRLGLSLGDRCCLSLARSLGLPVLTADRAWLRLSVGVEVNMVR